VLNGEGERRSKRAKRDRVLGEREGKAHQGTPKPGTASVVDANAAHDPVASPAGIASQRPKKKMSTAFTWQERRKWRGKTHAAKARQALDLAGPTRSLRSPPWAIRAQVLRTEFQNQRRAAEGGASSRDARHREADGTSRKGRPVRFGGWRYLRSALTLVPFFSFCGFADFLFDSFSFSAFATAARSAFTSTL